MGVWLGDHWLDLLHMVVDAGGLFFAGYSIREDAKVRRAANLLTIAERRDSIWRLVYEQPALARVLDEKANPHQICLQERLFVTSLIIHLDSVFQSWKAGQMVSLAGLPKDIQDFFSLPIPKAVWNESKELQSPEFISFMERHL